MSVPNHITEDVKALIGFEGEPETATHPIEESEVRRFKQAIMSGAPYVPATFPTFAFRCGEGRQDPLDAVAASPSHDGLDKPFRNLPLIPVELKRILNGGYQYYFYNFARIGEVIIRQSRYRDILQKNGRSGPMIFVVLDDIYYTSENKLLMTMSQNIIIR